jgi:predicted transcriptional regulator with HTH domain
MGGWSSGLMPNEMDIGHIYRSLKHSKIRDEVFNLVCNDHQEYSPREIADILKLPEKNILGALIGDKSRYKKEESLVEMGVIKCHEYTIHGYTILLFSATEEGLKIYRENTLKDYAYNTNDALMSEKHDEKGEEELTYREPTS